MVDLKKNRETIDLFDSEYIPDKCPHRDEVIKDLLTKFTLNTEKIPGKLFLVGPEGSGKTMVARKICSILRNEKKNNNYSIYVNCSIYRTEHMVLEQIIRSIKTSCRCKGMSSQSIIKSLINLLFENNIHLTIVLDDVHEFPDVKNLLGDLCQINDFGIKNASSKISFIATSLDINILSKLNSKSKRILELCTYNLEAYSTNEIYDILYETVKSNLSDDYTISNDVLYLIAETAGEKNDVKYAIDLLKESILCTQFAKSDNTISHYILNKKIEIYNKTRDEKIETLSKHELLCLLGICKEIKENNFTYTGSSYKSYIELCKEYGESMRSRCQFWRYLDMLSKHQIVSTVPTKGGDKYGNTTLIKLKDNNVNFVEDKVESLIFK